MSDINEKAAAGVDEYVNTGTSCPDLFVKYDVDIREFVILAFLRDCGDADAATIGSTVGLSLTTSVSCLARLRENELALRSDIHGSRFEPTADGIALLRKASR